MPNPLLDSLRRAVEASPDDLPLRLHLAALELAEGERTTAITSLGIVLARDPGNPEAARLMAEALGGPAPEKPSETPPPQAPTRALAEDPAEQPQPNQAAEYGPPPEPETPPEATPPSSPDEEFNWDAAEEELGINIGPAFVHSGQPDNDTQRYSSERPGLTLADVGGMDKVKERLTVAFLAPLKNPELRALYGKSLRGGLLMYGPPGCGKTYIARAIAGELGARFLPIGVADILDRWLGDSERNLHELFVQARRDAPCVVFLDELDTLGQRRSSSWSAMASVSNQLLTELDGVESDNEGVFVLGATNQPWQVDSALRRPGRFDRTVLVLPPDAPAREAIFAHHLKKRPVENIDLAKLAAVTDGYSGADLAHICETASEFALMDSVRSGSVRMIGMADLHRAMQQVRPSIGAWLDSVRNVVLYGEDDGTFNELRAYLKKAKRW